MSRTRRTIDPFLRKPQPMEMTWRGLGDPHPFMIEQPRHAGVNGYDGANRDGRHPNTKRREKRVEGKRKHRNHEDLLTSDNL